MGATATRERPYVLRSEEHFIEHFTSELDLPEGEPRAIPKWMRFYVNAYSVSQSFGGREEGGWWFDVGAPIASVPVSNYEEAGAAWDALAERYAEEYGFDGPDTRHLSTGGDDLWLCVENHFGKPFPSERPRYE